MRHFGAIAVFVFIAALIAAVFFLGRRIDQPVSQSDKVFASYNLTMITASPIRVSVPVNATSVNLTINAIRSQNGSASGAMKVVTKNLTFTSNNENIAVVSSGGQITGLSAGATFVTVAYTDGNVTKTVDVPVTVTAPAGT